MARRKKGKSKFGPPRWSTGNRDGALAAELRRLGVKVDPNATKLPPK